jgi:hypothetical protein
MHLQIIRYLILAVVLEFSLSACTTTKLFTPASTGPSFQNEVSSLNRTPALQTSYADVVDRDAPTVVTVR